MKRTAPGYWPPSPLGVPTLTPRERRAREVRALARALELEMERQDAAGYRDWELLTNRALAQINPLDLR